MTSHPEAPALQAQDLTKHYGRTLALEGLDLVVERGENVGFLGSNGAGKTTTLRLALDLIRPTRGTVRLFGRPPREFLARASVGYLPGDLALDDRLSGHRMLAVLDGVRPASRAPADPRRRAELCERLSLSEADLARTIREDSRGTQQKIGLVAALQHDPELLILDEPTTGLDPLVREALFEILRELGQRGRTVFHSSHVLSEVERVCSRVAILRAGQLVAVDTVDELRRTLTRRMVVRFAGPVPRAELDGLPGVAVLGGNGTGVELAVAGEIDPLLSVLARHPVRHLAFPEPDLDEAFARYYAPERAEARA